MVSVIIPVYNRRKLLYEAVSSVFSQTHQDFELIVVDDGSQDNSRQIARDYPQIVYHRISHSGFPGLVRNRGVELAQGEYLAFLDSDDLWEPKKLERQLDALNGCVLNHTRERWMRGKRELSQKSFTHKRSGWVFADALKKCTIGPSTVLMQRKAFSEIGGFREDLEIAEDYELWLRLTAVYPVSYCESPLVIKRAGHGEQLSEKYGHIEIFRIAGLRTLVDEGWFLAHADPECHRKARAVLAEKCRIYSLGAAKRGRTSEAEDFELLAQRYSREHYSDS
ncbi:MAG: glycosyltransferase family 2 protein [Spirochaetota bacterium]